MNRPVGYALPMSKPNLSTEFVRIAQSGPCVDGREIKPEWLTQMAETYNPDTYTALLWPEHRRWAGNFGHVLELRAEDADGVVTLSGRLCPNDRYIYENTRNQGLFFSIEVTENFAQTGKAYLTGLGVTDSPASLGTSMMRFSGQGGGCHVLPGLAFSLSPDNPALSAEEYGLVRKIIHFFRSGESPAHDEEDMTKEEYAALLNAVTGLSEKFDALMTQRQKEDKPESGPEQPVQGEFAALRDSVSELSQKFDALRSRMEQAKPGTPAPETTAPAPEAELL